MLRFAQQDKLSVTWTQLCGKVFLYLVFAKSSQYNQIVECPMKASTTTSSIESKDELFLLRLLVTDLPALIVATAE